MTAVLKLFDLLPGWAWAVALALALMGTSLQSHRLTNAQAALQKVQVDLAIEQAAASEQQRTIEQQRTDKVQEAQSHAQDQTTKLQPAVAAAAAADERVRAAAAARAASQTCARAPAATAGARQPGADALDLFVNVLSRHSRELVEVGKYADQLRIAGAACEQIGDAMSASSTSAPQ